MPCFSAIPAAIQRIPAGRWGVAVSGGADSVALLHACHQRADLTVLAVHLDHQTRAGQSTADAMFVADLAEQWAIPLHLRRRDEIEPHLPDLPANRQARYRRLRLELFAQAQREYDLRGILLAHHADDQAETVLMRLIRGSGIDGLAGIPEDVTIGPVHISRPLLKVRRDDLRDYLTEKGIPWREDASNQSPLYQRNRVRSLLARRPALTPLLLAVADAFGRLSQTLDEQSPCLKPRFSAAELIKHPQLVQLHSLRRWLLDQGVPPDEISLRLLDRLLDMIEDPATPPALTAPGGIQLRRRLGEMFVVTSDE